MSKSNNVKMSALMPIAKDGLTQGGMRGMKLMAIIDEIKLATKELLEVRSIYRRAGLTCSEIFVLTKCRKRVRTRLAKRTVRSKKRKSEETEIEKLEEERDRLEVERKVLIQEIEKYQTNYNNPQYN